MKRRQPASALTHDPGQSPRAPVTGEANGTAVTVATINDASPEALSFGGHCDAGPISTIFRGPVGIS